MKYAVVLLICLAVLSGCGGGSTGISSTGPATISGLVVQTDSYSGGAGQPDKGVQVLVYQLGHEGDPKYLVASAITGQDGRFNIQLPSAGTYAVDVSDQALSGPPVPGVPSQFITVVEKSWSSLRVPAGGVDLGTVQIPLQQI